MPTEPAPKGLAPLARPLALGVTAVGVLGLLCCGALGTYVLSPSGITNERLARAKVEQLSSAVELFKTLNGDYPERLAELAEEQPGGGAPLVTADQLLDPWGNPYHYDPAGPNNGGIRPDVWVQRPGRVIDNWPAKR